MYRILDNIFKFHLIDINGARVNLEESKNRQWWFPEAPEKVDDAFPRGVIDFGNSSFTNVGSDNYVDQTFNESYATEEYYGQYETIPVTLSVFVKKGQPHSVNYPADQKTYIVANSKQADFLGDKIPRLLLEFEEQFIDAGFFIDGDVVSGGSYEDGDYFWVVDITFNVETQALWKKSFAEGGVIKQYTLNTNVQTS